MSNNTDTKRPGFNNRDQIANFTSAITDNGRRGEPLPGCDCMRCFGYCLIDSDARQRELAELERDAREDEQARHAEVAL